MGRGARSWTWRHARCRRLCRPVNLVRQLADRLLCPCGGRQHGVRIRLLGGDLATPGRCHARLGVVLYQGIVGAVADVEVKPAVGAEEDVGSPATAAVSPSGSPRGWAVSIASVEIR